ncbi:uncharacterized protein LOC131942515 [Physella acuta]|uniref:uncharacterized protein LOC131942515 n=1 Tax=Physella acuta TaxID=109671 RepID=UPI0027DCA4B4|nr:uncharacterized protein LOC131942515 [Physella acuta]XP_059158405.1 uncharacterized protein LOC131942515 [Physella acuta]XP_059158406.1 uncharacterized protein LOC131942515 [Physella acuta]
MAVFFPSHMNYSKWPHTLLSMSVKKNAMVLFLFLAFLPTATKSDWVFTETKCFTRQNSKGSTFVTSTVTVEYLCQVILYTKYIVANECLINLITSSFSERDFANLNSNSFSEQYSRDAFEIVYVKFHTTEQDNTILAENLITAAVEKVSKLCISDRSTPSPFVETAEKDVVPAILWSVFGSAFVYVAISVGVVMLYRKMRAARRTKEAQEIQSGNEENINPYSEISPDVEAIAEGTSQRTEEDDEGQKSQMNKTVTFVDSTVVYENEVQEWEENYV